MTSKRKICVVTGTRAEYGLLYWVMKHLENDECFELQIVVTGMHLSPEYGLTYRQIENDGFKISDKVEMLMSSDTSIGIAKSIGLGTIGFADVLDRLRPDLLLVLGDRFEILSAVQAALVAKIPVAHIAGGDTTEGAFDEAIRHSITKMSHLHFVTNEQSARRVKQLGEDPKSVYVVGSPGIDQITKVETFSKEELEDRLNFRLRKRNILVTYHPVTLDETPVAEQFEKLLDALHELGPDVGLIFTNPNSDNDSRILIRMIQDFCNQHENAVSYTSLGQVLYLNTMKYMDIVLGNSSSGLYEAPSFKIPTVNIGNRQNGRLQATSIINCDPEKEAILKAIHMAYELDCTETINPYGDGKSSERIVRHLRELADYQTLLMKKFHEVTEDE